MGLRGGVGGGKNGDRGREEVTVSGVFLRDVCPSVYFRMWRRAVICSSSASRAVSSAPLVGLGALSISGGRAGCDPG